MTFVPRGTCASQEIENECLTADTCVDERLTLRVILSAMTAPNRTQTLRIALTALTLCVAFSLPVEASAVQPSAHMEPGSSPTELAPPAAETDTEVDESEQAPPVEAGDVDVTEVPLEDATSAQLTPDGSAPDPLTQASTIATGTSVAVVGVTWPGDAPAPASIAVRYQRGTEWSTWASLEAEEESSSPESGVRSSEPMAITDADNVEVVVQKVPEAADVTYSVQLIDPSALASSPSSAAPSPSSDASSLPQAAAAALAPLVSDVASVYGLGINTRRAWGADESFRNDFDMAEDYRVTYSGAVVHHTASSNDYSQAQVPSLIRGFYYYHAVTNGWGDIGYQLLVDRFGGVWEGRYGSLERVRLGSHALGGNYQTFGISVIGDYSNVAPSAAAQESTAKAIAWMFETYGIGNPQGSIWIPGSNGNGGLGSGRMVNTISGHRQVSVTACPGNAFFVLLPQMRNRVEAIMNDPLSGKISRFSGTDRFGTAAIAAQTAFPSGADTVYLATGTNYPDALAGGAAAGIDGAPMLLTMPDTLPPKTKETLAQLKPNTVVILGDERAISAGVEQEIASLAKRPVIERIGGKNRYETAALIAQARVGSSTTVYLGSGENFPDALSAGPVAGAHNAPMLLSTPDRLPEATATMLRTLQPSHIIVLGSPAALSAEVEQEAAALTQATITRIAGVDRFDTSARVTRTLHTGTVDTVYLSSGAVFPDALAGGPAAQRENAAMLLIHPGYIPASTEQAILALKPKRIVLVGGTPAISRVLERKIDLLLTR